MDIHTQIFGYLFIFGLFAVFCVIFFTTLTDRLLDRGMSGPKTIVVIVTILILLTVLVEKGLDHLFPIWR